ncbi:MAG: DUF2791 family P-loop domain-containing protein [Anaerolineae bacterium]|nr:DUF2791 family P-loop domain-containing protein [Anaerolineae bacterium]
MLTHLSVLHKQLGRGKLLRTLRDGQLYEVEFESGLRFILPSREFEPLPVAMPDSAFETRQTVEALRMGITPVEHIEDLTIGLDDERTRLHNAFQRTRIHGGAALAVLADYGQGKTHFIALAERSALSEGFLVSTLSLDQRELPPSRAKLIYQASVEALRYPDSQERGLQPLLERARQQPHNVMAVMEESLKGEECPFAFGVRAYLESESDAERLEALRYLEHRGNLRRAPRLVSTGNAARQYAYLFTAISALARAFGYSGLALLLDEVDYYSRLLIAQRERAKQLFKALIYASQGEESTALSDHDIPEHHKVNYPLRFSDRSAFFFLFASTQAPEQMPVSEWLSPSVLIYPNQRFRPSDVERFLKMVGAYHAKAYKYEANGQAATPSLVSFLAQALSNGRIPVRFLPQIAVTFYDLLYTYPHVSAETHVRDLARALQPER